MYGRLQTEPPDRSNSDAAGGVATVVGHRQAILLPAALWLLSRPYVT